MASNAMSVAYNEMSAMYGINFSGQTTRYDNHKKSELRNAYNSIVKTNKESPLYRIKETGDVKNFAIDIKARAHALNSVVSELSQNGEGIESAFTKKIASSDNPDVVAAEYVGVEEGDVPANAGFKLEVKSLATPQENLGNFLRRSDKSFKEGTYSFDLNTNTTAYEFNFNVNDDDTNEEVLNKIRKLINNSNIGLNAELVSDERGTSKALHIMSKQTGLMNGEDKIFDIVPQEDKGSKEAMELLGINKISSPAENSSFMLNGTSHSSYSNTFTVNNMFSVTLNGISQPGEAVSIGFKPSAAAVSDNIEALVKGYNGMIDVANRYSDTQQASSKLIRDMSETAKLYKDDLEQIGLKLEDTGMISVDRDKLMESVSEVDTSHTFEVLNKFRDALGSKANQTSINPMNYVNKVVVAYKNPGHNFATPYISSIYSGMMVDRFC